PRTPLVVWEVAAAALSPRTAGKPTPFPRKSAVDVPTSLTNPWFCGRQGLLESQTFAADAPGTAIAARASAQAVMRTRRRLLMEADIRFSSRSKGRVGLGHLAPPGPKQPGSRGES